MRRGEKSSLLLTKDYMGLGKVLINRNGAWGDMIHVTHLPRLLKDQGWDFVGVSTGIKGYKVLQNNPFVDKVHYFEFEHDGATVDYYKMRVKAISQEYDKLIDLLHSVERGALAMDSQSEFYMHQSVRNKMGDRNYYDIATELAGYPHLLGKYRGEMFFTEKEYKIVDNDLLREGRYRYKFKVLMSISGSGPHKINLHANELSHWIVDRFHDSVVFLTGDSTMKEYDISDNNRIRSIMAPRIGLRQLSLMTKYMDLAIGGETGVMCVASMWDIPAIHLLTGCNANNHCKYTKNSIVLQSPAKCSPCFKCSYKYYGCPKKDNLPLCVHFDINVIKKQIEKVYEEQYVLRCTS
jgi:ADP-heptose:LPS heptosyltransferase